LEEIYPNTP